MEDETVRLKSLLEDTYQHLDQMEAKGMHGVFNRSHDNVTIEQFKSNFNGLRQNEAALSSCAPGQKKYHESQIHNYKGMLIR